jgi:C4-dicarboxylate-specific signal transduction histidine kinase
METTESTFLWDLASEQEDVQADRELFSPLDSSQFPRSFERTVKMRDGSRRIIQWTATALTDIGGSVRMVIVIGIDNTERWRTELALYQASKLTTLGEMATAMAHELNQPLNVISLAAENLMVKLQRGTADEDFIANKVVRITSQVDRAAKIINHMRIFGRQPDGGFVPIDPRKSVENALDLLGQTLKISGIKVTVRMAEECPPVLGHATLLEQVVINLLNNAHDAILAHVPDICPAGGGRAIDLEVAHDAESDQVVISVQDTGGGIPDAALSRLFDPFFTTKPVGKGTGLGLSVTFGIINDMKGRIEAENRNGGARFTIYLPCIATAGAEAESVMA